jgi:acyl-CoA synthetase (AMP-forming)/AMP-acid ligase II
MNFLLFGNRLNRRASHPCGMVPMGCRCYLTFSRYTIRMACTYRVFGCSFRHSPSSCSRNGTSMPSSTPFLSAQISQCISTWLLICFRYRATTLYLVPSLVHQLVHRPEFKAADFSTVQVVHCGAAYLPVSLSEALLSRFTGLERIGEGGL